jgi:hypothetical protein
MSCEQRGLWQIVYFAEGCGVTLQRDMNRFLAEIHALDGTVDSVELRHDAPHEEGSSSAHEG